MTTETQAQAREALLACPFCGFKPEYTEWKGVWRHHHVFHCETSGCPAQHGVGSNNNPCTATYPTKDAAATAWNRRPHPDAPAGGECLVEAVEKAAKWLYEADVVRASMGWENADEMQRAVWSRRAKYALTAAGLPALVARVDSQNHELRDLVGESVEREAELNAWKQRAQQAESERDALAAEVERLRAELAKFGSAP